MGTSEEHCDPTGETHDLESYGRFSFMLLMQWVKFWCTCVCCLSHMDCFLFLTSNQEPDWLSKGCLLVYLRRSTVLQNHSSRLTVPWVCMREVTMTCVHGVVTTLETASLLLDAKSQLMAGVRSRSPVCCTLLLPPASHTSCCSCLLLLPARARFAAMLEKAQSSKPHPSLLLHAIVTW